MSRDLTLLLCVSLCIAVYYSVLCQCSVLCYMALSHAPTLTPPAPPSPHAHTITHSPRRDRAACSAHLSSLKFNPTQPSCHTSPNRSPRTLGVTRRARYLPRYATPLLSHSRQSFHLMGNIALLFRYSFGFRCVT